jgi:hypothetical protein
MANEPRWRSFEWRDQVRNDAEVTHFQWRVADAVAERVDRRTGYAQFFQRDIVKQLGCSIRGVHGALHQLTRLGHLEIQNLERADGKLRYVPVVGVRMAVRTPCASQCAPDMHGDSEQVRTAVRTKEPRTETPEIPREESISKSFDEEWWPLYPKRVSKGAARKAYIRIVKSKLATVEELKLGVMRYAAERAGQDPKFTKHAATWLNQECWTDEQASPQSAGSPGVETCAQTATPGGGNGFAALKRRLG